GAPGWVAGGGARFGVAMVGSAGAWAGVRRVPGGGGLVSGADDRITMKADPLFARSRKLPVNVAPAASVMLSPGWAASIAACRSPPAVTAIVRPGGGGGGTSTMARGRPGPGWADAMGGPA